MVCAGAALSLRSGCKVGVEGLSVFCLGCVFYVVWRFLENAVVVFKIRSIFSRELWGTSRGSLTTPAATFPSSSCAAFLDCLFIQCADLRYFGF